MPPVLQRGFPGTSFPGDIFSGDISSAPQSEFVRRYEGVKSALSCVAADSSSKLLWVRVRV